MKKRLTDQFICLILSGLLPFSGCLNFFKSEKCETLDLKVYSSCQQILTKGLHSHSFWGCIHAAEGLTSAGDTQIVLQTFLGRLEKENNDQKRCGLAREMIRAGDRSKINILTETLADKDSDGRVHAAESLFKTKQIGDLDLLIECAKDGKFAKVQVYACAALVRAGHKDSLDVLRKSLSSEDVMIRSLSAYLLGYLGDTKQMSQIKKNAEEPLEPIYAFFHKAGLLYMGDQKVLLSFRQYLIAPDKTVRALAANIVGDLKLCQFKNELINMLGDPVEDVRIRAAHALINMNTQIKN